MLTCIPTNGNAGLKDTVSDHFGSASFFTLYNNETDDIVVIENRNAHHSHGTCHPMNQLAKHKIDCVVCSGMGRRAIEALNFESIKVYKSESQIVEEIIAEIKSDSLSEMDPLKSCHGRGQNVSSENIHEEGRGSGFGQRQGRGQGCNSGHGKGSGRRRNR
jgi:predicted Fe-Mo cluster-binding NifX family protein